MTVANWQAIAFDFDGVLVESIDIKTKAFGALYTPYGDQVVARVRDYHLAHCGQSRYEKFRYFETVVLRKPEPSSSEMAALDRAFSSIVEMQVVEAPEVRGAGDLLSRLCSHLPLHVVSATPQQELLRIIASRGWLGTFKSALGSPTSKADNLRNIVEAGGHAPQSVLMVGDAFADFEAAQTCSTSFLGLVPIGGENPFPKGTRIIVDLHEAAALLAI